MVSFPVRLTVRAALAAPPACDGDVAGTTTTTSEASRQIVDDSIMCGSLSKKRFDGPFVVGEC
jgi:hypothetical protein